MTTGKPAGKKPFSRPRCGWDYSKMHLQQAERRTKEVAGPCEHSTRDVDIKLK